MTYVYIEAIDDLLYKDLKEGADVRAKGVAWLRIGKVKHCKTLAIEHA